MRWAFLTWVACAAFVWPSAASAVPGDIDETFSTDGFAVVQDRNLRIFPRDMALDGRGRIVVAADTQTKADRQYGLVLARLMPSGRRDRSFGDHGVVKRKLTDAVINAVATDSKDRVLFAGSVGLDAVVGRYLPNGKIDRSFGDDGLRRLDFSGEYGSVDGLSVLDNDQIVVAGNVGGDLFVAKLKSSGAAGRRLRERPNRPRSARAHR